MSLALYEGNSVVTGEFPHKEPETWKMFPCDDVIMRVSNVEIYNGTQLYLCEFKD